MKKYFALAAIALGLCFVAPPQQAKAATQDVVTVTSTNVGNIDQSRKKQFKVEREIRYDAKTNSYWLVEKWLDHNGQCYHIEIYYYGCK